MRYPILIIMIFTISISAMSKELADKHIEAVLLYQRHTGGWPKNINYDNSFNKNSLIKDKAKQDSTIDNGATTSEMRLLARLFQKTGKAIYKTAFLNGLDFLLKAQYKNGGWPQFYPNPRGYQKHITFNDNAMINVLTLLQDIERTNDYNFIDEQRKNSCTDALQRGIKCILECQIKVQDKLTVWCAQHDSETLKPAKARSYELASFSGYESVNIVKFLMTIDTPSPEIRKSIIEAVKWFELNKITGYRLIKKEAKNTEKGYDKVLIKDKNAPDLWARFYDLETSQPIYCSRDGIPKKHLSEISYERRNGYGWIGSYASMLLKKDYPQWVKKHL